MIEKIINNLCKILGEETYENNMDTPTNIKNLCAVIDYQITQLWVIKELYKDNAEIINRIDKIFKETENLLR